MKFMVMTFQVVTDDDTVCMEQSHKIPVEPCKHAPSLIVPSLAEYKAASFLREAVRKGVLTEPPSGESFVTTYGQGLGLHKPSDRIVARVDTPRG